MKPHEYSCVIITPTIGRASLARCMASVSQQTYKHITHLIIIDGADREAAVRDCISSMPHMQRNIKLVTLPDETGCGMYNGYRICAGFSYLVNEDIVFFLDDDNWFDPQHVDRCLSALDRHETEWAYSLRRICYNDGTFMIDDDSDSLGFWRRDAAYQGPSNKLRHDFALFYSIYPFLIDTNCFAFRRELLVRTSFHLLDGDCAFTSHLVKSAAGACTGSRTVNYRVRKQLERQLFTYFRRGRVSMMKRYNGALPWTHSQRLEPIALQQTTLPVHHASLSEAQRRIRLGSPSIFSHPDRRKPPEPV